MGPTHATLPIEPTSAGTIATPSTICAIKSVRNAEAASNLGAKCASRTATAPNDSQKPACRGADGSLVKTTVATHRNTIGSDNRRPIGSNSSTTTVASHERSTGIPQPARHEYNVTSTP